MFLLPILITFIALVITMLVINADPRVYSRNLRLDVLTPVAVVMFSASTVLSIILFIVGVR